MFQQQSVIMMERSCSRMLKELIKISQNIDVMFGEQDDCMARFIPYENKEMAMQYLHDIRQAVRMFPKYYHSNMEVYKFLGFLNKREKKLKNDILIRENQISLIPEYQEEELQKLREELRIVQLAIKVCQQGPKAFEDMFYVKEGS